MDTTQMLSESQEDYLKAIFCIIANKQAARCKEIAEMMMVKRSSVTGALQGLKKKGLVNYAPYEVITLTDAGENAAEAIMNRHRTVCQFLVQILGVAEEEVDEVACKIEHAISDNLRERLLKFVNFMDDDNPAAVKCREDFLKYISEDN
jgi:DtxR family transcriptional regulator, Mn-dependent transcriptional regulator